MSAPRHIVIIGNGITGVTAACHLRKRGEDRITIISAETEHAYSRPALMYIFMGDLTYADTKLHEDWFWAKNRIELRRGWVDGIDSAQKRIQLREGGTMDYDALVLATGSSSARFGWPGQDLEGVQGLYSYQDVETLERNVGRAKRAVIVGGGLIGIELAEMLHTRGVHVTMLVRERGYWSSVLPDGEAELINRHAKEHGVDLRFETELKEILSDAEGRARAVVTSRGEEIPCEIVGLTVGVRPNTGLAKTAGIECDRGILVDRFFRTSALDIFSGGDCAQHREPPPGRRPVEQVWYTGKMHGEYIAANLCGEERSYEPGVWFNSAKFFDIEYQTYGDVPSRMPAGTESFFWQRERMSIRVNFLADSGAVTGVNVFGLRHRHAVWEKWIREQTDVREVLANLGAANFDPEFFRQAEPEIVAAFNAQYPARQIELRTRRGLFSGYLRRLFGTPNVATP
jgi:NAD(P)H-nitrite reductase large subunit